MRNRIGLFLVALVFLSTIVHGETATAKDRKKPKPVRTPSTMERVGNFFSLHFWRSPGAQPSGGVRHLFLASGDDGPGPIGGDFISTCTLEPMSGRGGCKVGTDPGCVYVVCGVDGSH